jgi:hypothetical protein
MISLCICGSSPVPGVQLLRYQSLRADVELAPSTDSGISSKLSVLR